MPDNIRFNRKHLLLLLAIGSSLVLLPLQPLDVQEVLRSILNWISLLGPWRLVLFAILYIIATISLLPGFVLTLGAGALFGVIWGSILVSLSSISGASLAFLIGRHLARDWVEKKIRGNQKFEAIDRAVAREGWKIVGLTRLSPIFPFNLVNYAFGLTQIKLKDYFFASWIGMLPGTFMYVYIGSLGSDVAAFGTTECSPTSAEWVLRVMGLLATVFLIFYLTRTAGRALEKRVRQ